MSVTTIVNSIFTNARGFSAADRTAMITFQTNTIVPLYSINTPFDEYVQVYTEALKASDYADIENAVPQTWQWMLDCCEDVINEQIQTAGPTGVKRAVFEVQQTGTDPISILSELFNGIGVVDSGSRTTNGVFDIIFEDDVFPDLSKVVVSFVNRTSAGNVASHFVGEASGSDKITVVTMPIAVAAAPGNANFDNAIDNLLGAGGTTIMIIEVYP